MAVSAPQYRVVDLPDGVPDCLKGPPACSSQKDSKPQGAGSSFTFGKPKAGKKSSSSGGGFDPAKALKGAAKSKAEDDAESSACKTRGDGLFDGGAAFRRDGNKVIMAPNAFSPENAMKTFEELEKNQLLGSSGQSQFKKPSTASPNSTHSAPEKQPALQAEMAKAMDGMKDLNPAEMKGIFDLLTNGLDSSGSKFPASGQQMPKVNSGPMFDLGEDRPGSHSRASEAQPAKQGSKEEEYKKASEGFCFSHLSTEAPVYRLEQKGPTAKHPFKHIQVDIELPKLESVSEADLRIGSVELMLRAPPSYLLKVNLPGKVVDGESNAKWSKAKKRLTLHLRAH